MGLSWLPPPGRKTEVEGALVSSSSRVSPHGGASSEATAPGTGAWAGMGSGQNFRPFLGRGQKPMSRG